MKFDFIIVGQGIAGTCFAFELIKRNKSFIIIDKCKLDTASKIALGVYNPLVLKWFTKVWEVENQLKYFNNFYSDLSSFLNEIIVHNIGIHKFLNTAYEQNNWITKSSSNQVSCYMSSELLSINNPGLVNDKFYGLVNSSGRVNIQLLLKAFRHYCMSNKLLIDEEFDYKSLLFMSDSLSYKTINADKIIFCEGFKGIDNPFFNKIKFKPTKGELLIIYSKNLNLDKIIHSKFLFIPLGGDYYSVGATYDWKDISPENTLSGREKLINMLDSFLNIPYKIIDHKSGIRPSTFDRRPIVGTHDKYTQMYILNGLGTRGVLLAPYLVNILCDSIYSQISISTIINYNRL